MGRSGSCGRYLLGGCRTLEIYSGCDWIPVVGWMLGNAVSFKVEMSAVCESWFRILVPNDVTIVDMGDVPESSVSIPDLLSLSQQWPPAVISHMWWRQQELEGKQRFRQSRPSSCVYCGIWIKCDMYRHVARFHLDLAQL